VFPTANDHNWTEMYPDASEEILYDMPVPKGKAVQMTCYIDADHTHDQITRKSITGILLYINNTPIKWISKRQRTIKTSTYGSEMVAGWVAFELILEMWYTLQMLGVPLDGLALMLGDNLSVVMSTTIPSSDLWKKHQAICYHRIRECVVAKVIQFVHISSEQNLSDCLTKPLTNKIFLGHMWRIFFGHNPIENANETCQSIRMDTNSSKGPDTESAALEKGLERWVHMTNPLPREEPPLSSRTEAKRPTNQKT